MMFKLWNGLWNILWAIILGLWNILWAITSCLDSIFEDKNAYPSLNSKIAPDQSTFDLVADMKANPLKYGVPIYLDESKITTENIPGPHPIPKKQKLRHRSILDDWEITQNS